MTPDSFLQKLLDQLQQIKTPVVIILFIISIIQIASSSFVGGHDDRAVYSRIAWLFFIAALLFAGDKIIISIASAFGQ